MGERGQPTRMLAAKYGGYLTFGALGGGKESAPGQPTLRQLRQMYRLPQLTPDCQVHAAAPYASCHAPLLLQEWSLLSCVAAHYSTIGMRLLLPCTAQSTHC